MVQRDVHVQSLQCERCWLGCRGSERVMFNIDFDVQQMGTYPVRG